MTFPSRELKTKAADRLQNAKNQKDIVLLYAAITLGLPEAVQRQDTNRHPN